MIMMKLFFVWNFWNFYKGWKFWLNDWYRDSGVVSVKRVGLGLKWFFIVNWDECGDGILFGYLDENLYICLDIKIWYFGGVFLFG